ncbi:Do family serine endopeptidase [Terrihabitans sp. B22-R8]|uniref:Do family serine endopeptidase n=1 Tax=Terrihabitans sp. B22-R8 TaxID=3425128 RepID=UPI00403CC584
MKFSGLPCVRYSVATMALVLATSVGTLAQQRSVPNSPGEVRLSYAPVARQVSPAVVNVYASRVVAQRARAFPFEDPLFQEFFGRQIPSQPRERLQRSLGSGVLVDPAGLIVTNNHVIDGMTDVRVSLADQREFDVDVVLTDAQSDIAVLRIREGKGGFPVLPLAENDDIEVGDMVLAVGNPFGLGQTVTQGILSAVRRVQNEGGAPSVYLQTDAAINQGNSGGALVDMRGQLVGINTAIFSKSGGSDGIGFAVPTSIVRLVIDAARKGDGVVRRPWLGAELQIVTREIAESLGLDRPMGALVTDVDKNSPAEKAGLKAGDLVTAVDGRAVDDPMAMTYWMTIRPLGSQSRLTMMRDGREMTLNVRIEAAPETVPRSETVLSGRGPFSGAKVVNLSPAVSEEMGLSGPARGVIVVDLARGSVAARLGIERKDRVLAVNDEEVASVGDLERLNDMSARFWKVTIQRNGRVLTQVFRF